MKTHRFFFLFVTMILILSMAQGSFAQSDEDAARQYHEGIELYQKSHYREAAEKYENVLKYFETIGNHKGISELHNKLGLTQMKLGDHEKASQSFQRTLFEARKQGYREDEAFALYNLGQLSWLLGDCRKALEYYKISLTIYQELKNQNSEATVFRQIGVTYSELRDYERALRSFEEALKICKESDVLLKITLLIDLGSTYINLGKYEKASKYFQESVDESRKADYKEGEAIALNNIGQSYEFQGDYYKALEHYESSLAIYQELNIVNGQVRALSNIGAIHCKLGDYKKALQSYENSLDIAGSSGNEAAKAQVLNNIGQVYDNKGFYEKALSFYEKALNITQELGDKNIGYENIKASTLHNIGVIYKNTGDYKKAMEYFRSAYKIAEETGNKRVMGITLNSIGLIYYYQAYDDKALEYYDRALKLTEELRNKENEASILNNLGNIYRDQRKFQQSLEYNERALKIARELGEKHLESTALNNMGFTYRNLGKIGEALECSRESLAIAIKLGSKSLEATALSSIGIVEQELGNYEKALENYETALKYSIELGDKSGVAVIGSNIGSIYDMQGDYEKAREYYGKALQAFEELAERRKEAATLGNIGLTYDYQGDNEKALELYEKSLKINREIENLTGQARDLSNIGSLNGARGDYTKARECFEEALAIATKNGDKNGQARTLANLGSVHCSVGDYQNALLYDYRALEMMEDLKNRSGQATVLNNIGMALVSLREHQKAREYYEKALKLFEELGEKNGKAQALVNIGAVLDSQADYNGARQRYEEALKMIQKIGDKRVEAQILNNMGNTYMRMGHLEWENERQMEARQYSQMGMENYQKSLSIARQLGNRKVEAGTLNNLGFTYSDWKDYKGALECFNKSLEISVNAGDDESMILTYWGLGSTCERMGEIETAVDYLKKSISKIETIRGKLKEERYKTSLLNDKQVIYEKLIKLLKQKGKNEEAWEYAERAKARTLLDSLGNQKIDFRAKASPELMKKESELKDRINSLRISLDKEERKEKRQELFNQFEDTLKEYEEILGQIKLTNPDYASLISVQVNTLKDIQDSLQEDSIILEYFTGQEMSLLFIVGKREFNLIQIPVKEGELRRAVQSLRKKIGSQSSCEKDTEHLSELLIPGEASHMIEGKRQLIIIPHSSLHYLPFSLLTDPEGEYLVKNYEILTEPSASTWRLCARKERKKKDSFAGYALGDTEAGFLSQGKGGSRELFALSPELIREGLSPLPGTKDEVESIGKLYRNKAVLVGKEMTSEKVEETVKGKSIIHFATHGLFNPAHPMFSGLVLSDDILYVHDIFSLDIDSDLVVLSACNTAVGELSGGDEIVGMSRAFMYAGSSSVIASLWSVSDESTSKLMKCFYRNLREGKSEAESLREAQAELMKEYPAAFHWAPFILIGK